MVLKKDNIAWATGRNTYGQLGDGDGDNRSRYAQVFGTWTPHFFCTFAIACAQLAPTHNVHISCTTNWHRLWPALTPAHWRNSLTLIASDAHTDIASRKVRLAVTTALFVWALLACFLAIRCLGWYDFENLDVCLYCLGEMKFNNMCPF